MAEIVTDSIQIAKALKCEHKGEVVRVQWATSLDRPLESHLTFCAEATNSQLEGWNGISGVIIGPPNLHTPAMCAHLVSNQPRRDFGRVLQLFFTTTTKPHIEETVIVHPSVKVGKNVSIGHNTVIEEGVIIGDDVSIGHNSTVLARTRIGNRSIIGSNTVLGSIGFGLEKDESDSWSRIPHIGFLNIEEDVEVGSSTVIARGTITETRIGRNCKIDDNVFIAHNVIIGENSVVIANAEISGSVIIGKNCWVGPASTIIQGLRIGQNSLIGIGSVVIKDVKENEVVAGNPAKVLRKQTPR